MMIDWKKIREYFPALQKYVYLSSAGGAPISTFTHKEAVSYYDEMHEYGDSLWNHWLEKVEQIRIKTASLINASPDEIAFVQNTSQAMNYIAQMLKNKGDVLAMDDDFPTATIPFLKQDYFIDFVKSGADCIIRPEDIISSITSKTKIITASSVQYATGFKQDIEKVGAICKERNIIFVVDASQSVCAVPLDVEKANIDFLVFSCNKWCISGYGIGVMYINKKFIQPTKFPAASWMSVKNRNAMDNKSTDYKETASMLETGGPSFPNIFALGGTIDFINRIGLNNIYDRIIELTNYLHAKLLENNIKIVSSTNMKHRSGITIIQSHATIEEVKKLAEKNILVSARNRGIRISLHFYNNFEDINTFVKELANIRLC